MAIEINGTTGISGVDGSASTPALQGSDSNTGISFGTDEVAINTGGTERVKVDSSGQVGINQTTPASALHVSGASAARFQLSTDNTGHTSNDGVRLQIDGSNNLEILQRENANIEFFTNNTERMRILPGGGLRQSVNTSDSEYFSDTSSNYSCFHNDTDNQVILLLEQSADTNPYGVAIDFTDASPDNLTEYFISCQDSTSTRFRVYSDGDVQNHDNSYGGFSDVKLKQDIVDAGSQWDDIKDLRVRKFKFKADVSAYGSEAKTLIGLVAQEAELVSPGLVTDSPDKDDEGNDLGTVTKSVRYSVLYMKAIKALQEAQTRIETLESQHADLLARVTALEAAS